MLISAAQSIGPMLKVTWDTGSQTEYPLIWLRDNCASGFHPETMERQFDLLSVPHSIGARAVQSDGHSVRIQWEGDPPHESRFDAAWLDAHRPGVRAKDPADVSAELWRASFKPPRFRSESLLESDSALLDFAITVKRSGIVFVDGLGSDAEAGFALGKRMGFLRPTNFGLSFRVESKPNPNALAYTADALPLHTDLPNHELPPGFQFLHCLSNDAEGGGSIFADGFAIAEQIRREDTRAFELLSRVAVPFRFHDDTDDIRVHRPMIGLDERGRVFDIRYSAHLAEPLDMEPAVIIEYYRAYRLLMAATRAPQNQISLRLEAGQAAIFDNRRVLHGRAAYRPNSGYRLLSGFYVDRAEWDSRIRRLSQSCAG